MTDFQPLNVVIKGFVQTKKSFGNFEEKCSEMNQKYSSTWDYTQNPLLEEYYNKNGGKIGEAKSWPKAPGTLGCEKFIVTNTTTQETWSGENPAGITGGNNFNKYEFKHQNQIITIWDSNNNGYIDTNDKMSTMELKATANLQQFNQELKPGEVKTYNTIGDYLSNS